MLKDVTTYQIIDPGELGLEMTLPLGKHSGRHAFARACAAAGVQLDSDELAEAFARFKALADDGGPVTVGDVVGEGDGAVSRKRYAVSFLAGHGIGPEVVAEASRAIGAVSHLHGFLVDEHHVLFGADALMRFGHPYPTTSRRPCSARTPSSSGRRGAARRARGGARLPAPP